MKLSKDEIKTVQQGQCLQFEEGDMKYVIVRADLFERCRGLLTDAVSAEAITSLVDDAMADYDADDPLLSSYQKQNR